jgi:hypothetical protein
MQQPKAGTSAFSFCSFHQGFVFQHVSRASAMRLLWRPSRPGIMLASGLNVYDFKETLVQDPSSVNKFLQRRPIFMVKKIRAQFGSVI